MRTQLAIFTGPAPSAPRLPSSRRELLRYPATRRWSLLRVPCAFSLPPQSIGPNKRAYPRISLSASLLLLSLFATYARVLYRASSCCRPFVCQLCGRDDATRWTSWTRRIERTRRTGWTRWTRRTRDAPTRRRRRRRWQPPPSSSSSRGHRRRHHHHHRITRVCLPVCVDLRAPALGYQECRACEPRKTPRRDVHTQISLCASFPLERKRLLFGLFCFFSFALRFRTGDTQTSNNII